MNNCKFKLIIDDQHANLRIDKYLGSVEQIGTRTRATYLIEQKKVSVNGEIVVKNSLCLKTNDTVEIDLAGEMTSSSSLLSDSKLIPLNIPLEIVYEDSFLLVINKPSGLVVHPAAGHEQDTLVNALIYHVKDLSMKFGENRPGIVHRLDKDTSGLMVIAKNDQVHEALTAKFKIRDIHRYYLAVAIGNVQPPIGTIKSYLARHPSDRKKYASQIGIDKKIIRTEIFDENKTTGKWAITNYKVLSKSQRAKGLTYLSLKLHTGRTHQIRVHMSELGFPLLADEIYGVKKLSIKKELNWPRLALHAAELGFEHPITKNKLFFKAPWPTDLIQLIQDFGFDPNPELKNFV